MKAVRSTSADGQYGLGDRLEIVVEFTQPVSANGDIQLSLETNNNQRFATMIGVESETRLKFDYVITQGDSTNDLDYSNQLSLIIGDGVLESLDGKPASLKLPKPGIKVRWAKTAISKLIRPGFRQSRIARAT